MKNFYKERSVQMFIVKEREKQTDSLMKKKEVKTSY